MPRESRKSFRRLTVDKDVSTSLIVNVRSAAAGDLPLPERGRPSRMNEVKAEELCKTDMLLEYAEKIVGKSVALVRNGLRGRFK